MKIASDQDIQDFVEEVREEAGSIEKAILYGSYARDEHDTGSDIDIAFIATGEVDEDKVFEIVDRYRFERDLAFSPRIFEKQDFMSKLEENYSFHTNVMEEGVEI